MGFLERFPEREGKAENFPTLKKRLPPLNSSYERFLQVLAGGSSRYLNQVIPVRFFAWGEKLGGTTCD
jgi:hypothetical protein